MKIFKYPIKIVDHQQIMMPKGAHLLHVGYDPIRTLCVWAKCHHPEKEHKPVDIWVVGTGNHVEGDAVHAAHLDTINVGQYMWHIFWSRKA